MSLKKTKNKQSSGCKLDRQEINTFLSVLPVRNKDMSWPEEMSFIANSSKIDRHKGKSPVLFFKEIILNVFFFFSLNY